MVDDNLFMICIRRAILDSFWAREPSTVQANRREVEKSIRTLETVGVNPQFEPLGPFPKTKDIQGISVAITMVLRSLDPGRYALYSQFETIRKLRSAYSNAYLASAKACALSATMRRATTKYFLTNCPTQSL